LKRGQVRRQPKTESEQGSRDEADLRSHVVLPRGNKRTYRSSMPGANELNRDAHGLRGGEKDSGAQLSVTGGSCSTGGGGITCRPLYVILDSNHVMTGFERPGYELHRRLCTQHRKYSQNSSARDTAPACRYSRRRHRASAARAPLCEHSLQRHFFRVAPPVQIAAAALLFHYYP
jgi:hypothetical protein